MLPTLLHFSIFPWTNVATPHFGGLLHFLGCLHFLGLLHFLGRLHFLGSLSSLGCFHLFCRLHFKVVFIFMDIFTSQFNSIQSYSYLSMA